jgi:hypothetical protein
MTCGAPCSNPFPTFQVRLLDTTIRTNVLYAPTRLQNKDTRTTRSKLSTRQAQSSPPSEILFRYLTLCSKFTISFKLLHRSILTSPYAPCARSGLVEHLKTYLYCPCTLIPTANPIIRSALQVRPKNLPESHCFNVFLLLSNSFALVSIPHRFVHNSPSNSCPALHNSRRHCAGFKYTLLLLHWGGLLLLPRDSLGSCGFSILTHQDRHLRFFSYDRKGDHASASCRGLEET